MHHPLGRKRRKGSGAEDQVWVCWPGPLIGVVPGPVRVTSRREGTDHCRCRACGHGESAPFSQDRNG